MHPLPAPPILSLGQTLHRQGIQQLVGQQHTGDGGGSQFSGVVVAPSQGLTLYLPNLALPEGGAGFHQHQLQPLPPPVAGLGQEDAQITAQPTIPRPSWLSLVPG